jgi:glycosyltransferase involved in cell wall biosynthesis
VNILFITAGAAGMYCGSCLRDNALAAELKSRGHDVVLVPLYTPTLTDEPNVSEERVFFGGISVYLQQKTALFRKMPRWFDRFLDSPWLIKKASSRSISTDPRTLGEMTISMLKGEEGFQRREFEKMLEWLAGETPPDVIQLPNALLASLAAPLKRELKRPIHCTLQGEDLFLGGLQQSHRDAAIALIRKNAEFVDRFTAVSEYYATFMAKYLGIAEQKIDVVPLGINLDGYAPRTDQPRPFTVGYLARIAPEKGLHVLCDAYVQFRQKPGVDQGRLEVAGYMAADKHHYLQQAEQRLAKAGLGSEFHYRGTLDRDQKIAFLRGLDVFSVPTTYVEPKGMFLLEALACGVPAVEPRHGAFPEILTRTGGGVLTEPGNVDSLAEGLHALWSDIDLRADLGRRGFNGVRRHYSIERSADRMLEVYERSRSGAGRTGPASGAGGRVAGASGSKMC